MRPWNFSGSGRSAFASSRIAATLTDSSPVFVLNSVPVAPDEIAEIPVLERVQLFGAERVERHVELDAAAHVLQRREGGLAHHALQHHPPGDRDGLVQRFEVLVGLVVELVVQMRGERIAPEVVRIRLAARAQRGELCAALGDDLVLVLRRRGGRRRIVLVGHGYTPCFRLAAMKSSRSPSRMACVLPTS